MKRFCHTCSKTVDDHHVMGAYWMPADQSPCPRQGCDAKFNIEKEVTAWRAARAAASDHCGPDAAPCAVCGEEIAAYETRQFGRTGAVHMWKPNTDERSCCYNASNKDEFPFHYTDG